VTLCMSLRSSPSGSVLNKKTIHALSPLNHSKCCIPVVIQIARGTLCMTVILLLHIIRYLSSTRNGESWHRCTRLTLTAIFNSSVSSGCLYFDNKHVRLHKGGCDFPAKRTLGVGDSSVNEVTMGWKTGVWFPAVVGTFSFATAPGPAPTSTLLLSNEYRGLFPASTGLRGVKITHSLTPSSVEVKMRATTPPLPTYVFMVRCLIKHRIPLHGTALN
jgi:hypothetical protein